MFKEGDKVKLKRNASSSYRSYFSYDIVYIVHKFERGGGLVVYVDGNSGLHGTASDSNFEYASRIHIGGE